MSTLTNQDIVKIAKRVAAANNVAFTDVSTAPALDSTGASAIEVRYVLRHGSSAAVMGEPLALTVSELIRELADRGEERFPIVRYEEKVAAGS